MNNTLGYWGRFWQSLREAFCPRPTPVVMVYVEWQQTTVWTNGSQLYTAGPSNAKPTHPAQLIILDEVLPERNNHGQSIETYYPR